MRGLVDSSGSVTSRIVQAIAAHTDRDSTSVPPIGTVTDTPDVDTDALDALFSNSSEDAVESLTFVYEGCRITSDGDGGSVEDAL